MSEKASNILVTGGAGFIGSHLVRLCIEKGMRVRILDNLSTGSMDNLKGLDVDFVEGDICCVVTADKACADMDTVFHLAANPSVALSTESPLECHRVNTLGALTIFEAAKRAGAKRFVFTSSCAVYGDTPPPCTEKSTTNPLSPYAAAKLASEAFLTTMDGGSLYPTICRLFNVYGPGQSLEGPYAAVIPAFINAAREGRSPTIYGDGQQTRDFVHVDDVVQALLAAAEANSDKTSTFNIGTGNATSLIELVETIAKVTKTEIKPEFGPPRPGDIKHSFADVRSAKDILGWNAAINLESGVASLL